MFFRREGSMIYMERDYSSLYRKIFYLSPADTIINKVTEYDLKSAGFNSLIYNSLVHPDIIKRLSKMEKEERNVAIGLMVKRDPKLGKAIQRTVTDARRQFFQANKVLDADVLSIKNDAVYIIGRRIRNLEFGNMKFVEKNVYTSFHLFDKIEMYYNNQDERIDIKGIDDKVLEKHDEYMLKFLAKCFNYIELGMLDKLRKYLIDFSISYKSKKLHPGYYRELSSRNFYIDKERIITGNKEMVIIMKNILEEDLETIDISYNFINYILPLINRYL